MDCDGGGRGPASTLFLAVIEFVLLVDVSPRVLPALFVELFALPLVLLPTFVLRCSCWRVRVFGLDGEGAAAVAAGVGAFGGG